MRRLTGAGLWPLMACAALALFSPATIHGQPSAAPGARNELARLDALLAAGELDRAATLLEALAPELAKDDRLAFDTIYVLVGRGRFAEARAQWNRLAVRVQERLRARPSSAGEAAGASGPVAIPPRPDVTDPGQRLLGEALFTQGLLVARGGGKDEALTLLRQADAYGFPPLDSPLMLLAAECLRDLQEYDLAAGAYREFLKRHPSNAAARLGLATVFYAARKFGAAEEELGLLLRQAPGTPRAHYLLGAVLAEQNRFDDARRHLERELTSDPRCIPCLSRLAHLAYREGDDARCESLLAKAATLDPADVETHMVSGLLASRQGRYAAAIDHLSRVIEQSPSYSVAQYQLAIAYRRSGDAAKAREHFEAYERLLKEQKAREIGFRGEK